MLDKDIMGRLEALRNVVTLLGDEKLLGEVEYLRQSNTFADKEPVRKDAADYLAAHEAALEIVASGRHFSDMHRERARRRVEIMRSAVETLKGGEAPKAAPPTEVHIVEGPDGRRICAGHIEQERAENEASAKAADEHIAGWLEAEAKMAPAPVGDRALVTLIGIANKYGNEALRVAEEVRALELSEGSETIGDAAGLLTIIGSALCEAIAAVCGRAPTRRAGDARALEAPRPPRDRGVGARGRARDAPAADADGAARPTGRATWNAGDRVVAVRGDEPPVCGCVLAPLSADPPRPVVRVLRDDGRETLYLTGHLRPEATATNAPAPCGANVDRNHGGEIVNLVCRLPRGHRGAHNTGEDGGGDIFPNMDDADG